MTCRGGLGQIGIRGFLTDPCAIVTVMRSLLHTKLLKISLALGLRSRLLALKLDCFVCIGEQVAISCLESDVS